MARFRTRGQPRARATVERAIRTERPPHALLLVGPEGVGKTTLALDLARGLLCLADDPADRPCGDCAACRKVDHGNHPDLHHLAPQGAGQQIRLGQVQALAGALALLPLEGRFRLAIVEHAQRLNQDAQNALLKTLEEPPPAVTLVLCADDSGGLMPTVVSRCARLRLGPVSPDSINELLAERGSGDGARAAALARVSGGRPGVALALAATPETLLVRDRLARTLLQLVGSDRRRRLAAAPELLGDGAALAAAVTRDAQPDDAEELPATGRRGTPAERRAAASQVIAVWRDVARDLAIVTRGGGRELSMLDLLDDVRAAGVGLDRRDVDAFIGRLDALGRALDAYANPDLVLDTLLLQWPRPAEAA